MVLFIEEIILLSKPCHSLIIDWKVGPNDPFIVARFSCLVTIVLSVKYGSPFGP